MGNISIELIMVLFLLVEGVFCQICWKEERTAVSRYNISTDINFVTCVYSCNWNQQQKLLPTTCSQNHCYIDYEVSRKQVCCEGYYKSGDECIPVCGEGCDNGRCTAPGTCTCNDGYQMWKGKCAPHCKNCSNGNCVAPNQCICSAGFVKNSVGLCDPKCEEDCINGICNERNECVCRDGYYFNEKFLDYGIKNNTVCTAKCDLPCSNGECTGRNRCECWNGYELSKSNPYDCAPICDPSYVNCSNGMCVAPNKCVCNDGFKLDQDRCVPKCDLNCVNGDCTSPGECTCKQGYQKTYELHICDPLCEPSCQNGACRDVNKCSCFTGYRKVNSSYCEPICEPRYIDIENGTCIAPNVLRCDEGFMQQETAQQKLACVSRCQLAEQYQCKTFLAFMSEMTWILVAGAIGFIVAVIIIYKMFSGDKKESSNSCKFKTETEESPTASPNHQTASSAC